MASTVAEQGEDEQGRSPQQQQPAAGDRAEATGRQKAGKLTWRIRLRRDKSLILMTLPAVA